jgi:hypothetical protein
MTCNAKQTRLEHKLVRRADLPERVTALGPSGANLRSRRTQLQDNVLAARRNSGIWRSGWSQEPWKALQKDDPHLPGIEGQRIKTETPGCWVSGRPRRPQIPFQKVGGGAKPSILLNCFPAARGRPDTQLRRSSVVVWPSPQKANKAGAPNTKIWGTPDTMIDPAVFFIRSAGREAGSP